MKTRIGMILKSRWFWFIGAGYFLRILMMPITGQNDVMFMPWMTHFINLGHFNLYAFLYEKFGDIILQRGGVLWAPYPYGFYLFTAGWLEVLRKLGLVDLAAWDSAWQVAHTARLVFLFKAAYLPFDLCIGYILFRTSGRLGLTLWAWSPAAIYTSFMMGQNDIYATTFAVAGICAATKAIQIASQNQRPSHILSNKWALFSCILLGVGSVFKIYPLFLLPPLVLIIGKQWRQRLVLLCAGCSIFVIFSIPFITTPTYINSVLLNPEGTKIFQNIQLFGFSVSPFLLGYIILLGYLSFGHPSDQLPQMAWFISLIVLAFFFLWVPTPFYWLIWITPILIGVVNRNPKMLSAWIFLQLTFALLLLSQHRELGVALPVHLMDLFNIPNLPTALVLTHPALYKIFNAFLPIVNGCLAASLLFIIWCVWSALFQANRPDTGDSMPHQMTWIALPTTLMLVILSTNLFFSKDLVSQSNWYPWQNQTLTAGDYAVQKLSPESNEITGVRMRLVDTTPSTTIKMCLYRNSDINQEPLTCITRNTDEQVENRVLFFVFDKKISLADYHSPTAKFQIEEDGATIVLPYTTSMKRSLQFNETRLNGSLDLSTLSSFSIADAFDKLIVQNILHDPWLSIAILFAITLVGLFLGILFLKLHSSIAE